MRENIIEQLRFCAEHFSCDGCGGDCKTGSNEPRTKAVLNDAADAIEELLAAVPQWISVEDELPEESYDGFSDDVLMLIEEPDGDKIWRDPYVGYYLYDACSDETGWWVKMTCDCTKVGEHKHGGKIYKANEYVTHWMPLPEAPKEVE